MKHSHSPSLSPQPPICQYWQRKSVITRNSEELCNTRGEKSSCCLLRMGARKKFFAFNPLWSLAKLPVLGKGKLTFNSHKNHHGHSRSLGLLLPILRNTEKWDKSRVGGRRMSQTPECNREVPTWQWLVLTAAASSAQAACAVKFCFCVTCQGQYFGSMQQLNLIIGGYRSLNHI